MTIRVGILGRNFVVDWMLAAMEQVPELRPAAIYSRNEETGREFAKKYHLDAVFTDLEAFAASDAFDAAYIASPNLCHFDQAMCLLRHGKHVLLEKPGVLTRKQTETLVETANANHVVYLEAMRLVFDDALPIIRDALPEIGTLRRVTAEFTRVLFRSLRRRQDARLFQQHVLAVPQQAQGLFKVAAVRAGDVGRIERIRSEERR